MRAFPYLLICAAICTAHAELPPQVERVLTGHGISPDDVSIVVQAVDAAEPILSHLADVPRNPASVMKVVTTWTALEVLGPAYTWPTEVYFLGDFDGKELLGDLVLKGYGDPYLVLEEFWKLLRALRRVGLEHISGDLVLDDSYFDVDEGDPGAFDGQPYRAYNVVPNALLLNFKAVNFQFLADPVNGRVNIATDPILSNLDIRNDLELVDGPCTGYQAGISFNHADAKTLDKIVFDGGFSRRCRPYSMSRTVLQHDTYAFGLFQSLWREVGGRLGGNVRREIVPADAMRVMIWQSRPLGEVIRSINKNSNNVMTRQLLYTLAAEQFGAPGTRENGIKAVREFLTSRGLDDSSLTLTNGAGLARDEKVSARLLADILRAAQQSAYAPEFIASLSLGGMDGTTRGRFGETSGNGRMHVKTGRIDHVSALAGYLHAAAGKNYVVAIMLNTQDAHRGPGQELEEAVTQWVQALR
ncbi:MAG TPA: D-alanyl-D-alanine carboxypeptidase/D-alanyl-D-alanine-endopeptidase [Gammaproteobacteria bacterium]|nr:D-alanyl-D-alanine carboxypeptidase/D-alanyl-D-alanine-endopeptidase [Gammaproteobacteria bacterium]